jgi:hypothetical protein
MRALMTAWLLLLAPPWAANGAAQQPPQAPGDSGQPASSTSAPIPPPPTPTPAQERYLRGLRTAGRGVAQIKDGIDRLARTQATNDTLRVRQAGRRLGGLCAAARGFLVSGRGQMEPTAYEPPARRPARDLAVQIDSLAVSAQQCQQAAARTPAPVSAALLGRLRAYEAALAAFRTAIGLPHR